MESKLGKIEGYWTQRASGYSESVMETVEDGRYRHWLGIIERHLPEGGSLRILDVGCGPGFFPVILGREGHSVTAVDYTEAMLEQARENCARHGVDAEFHRMDAQHLDFEDDSFDVVISRNLVWDLESPRGAYREWLRVVRPGGKLMVFDGNHYLYLYDSEYADAPEREERQTEEHRHIDGVDVRVMEDIARQLPLSRERRPQWDVDNLIEMGAKNIVVDTDGRDSYRVVVDGETVYLPSTFFICVTK
mgnify:CR=1 FL=1